ncbi:unnamed protein product (macronuclear) [Paramecium tetraurelia]|uniref:Phosphoinositide phospholipase C n=1 Tax=Paramecium tetraurelia TaxID=5888 RepID=A0BR56_PARTE|nr:uncharacterized protein GSPATT00031253001 [Paramecium tetraurelia]CAK61023.1 unnamed protein product [Paramecium tetraurelia]|eukprot:XP_001428421.1 hypothetical protein (macronuclear) [Paramecium tetraurelia strain d4-2]
MKGRKSSASKFDRKEFDQRTLSAAVNLIVYGCHVQKYNKSNRKPISRLYYLYEEDMDYLQYLHAGRPFTQCRIPLLDIIELREIPTTESFQNLPYQRTLQITFASKKHTILFNTKNERDLFWQGLQYFIDVAEHNLIRDIKSTNDNQIVEQITLKQIKGMLPQLSITKQELKSLFNQYDLERRGFISSSDYQDLLKRLMNQDFVRFIFDKYAVQQMNKQEFIKFLTNEQSPNQKQCEDAFRLFAKQDGNNYSLSFLEFLNYLLSTYNQLFDYQKTQIYQSEDYPLTDYWINSSHNTYLMGDQLTSESSIQAYINAFQKGCRCVELDCWDGDNNQPIIYHGFTMTSRISFESVIQTIKEYGFKYSKYPLILSLEVHCCVKQQDVMADILKTYLNENLLLLPDDYKSSEYYPKLNKLYYKVIIKHRGKMKSSLQYRERFISISPINIFQPNFEESESPDILKRPSLSIQGDQQQLNTPTTLKPRSQKSFKRQDHGLPMLQLRNTINPFQIDEEMKPNKVIHKTKTETTLRPKYKISNIETQFQFDAPNPRCQIVQLPLKVDSDEDISIDKAKKEKAESLKMSSITALFGAAIKQQNRTVWEISSLDESKVNENLLDFHRRYFTRIYPSGSRVDSSNYDPIPAFNSGSQIVALNFQTNDMPMLLNMCKFMENGGIESGYVLKPQWMRSDGKKKIGEFSSTQLSFTLSLLVGYNLRQLNNQNAKVNPQIKISIRGLLQDEQNNKPQIATISQSGLNPQFNFIYKYNIKCPDLAFLIFEVLDASKNFLGWSAIPLSCMSFGYRAVQLLSQYLKPLPKSCLLVHVQKNTD